jgi:hypothetical protein
VRTSPLYFLLPTGLLKLALTTILSAVEVNRIETKNTPTASGHYSQAMRDRLRPRPGIATGVRLSVGLSLSLAITVAIGVFALVSSQSQALSKGQKENKTIMTTHAAGTFEVKMTPQAPDDKGPGATVGRYLLDKQFHGDLEGTSKGEMLAVGTAIDGSAGYVAMEHVAGTLNGRKGSFALQHSGTMTRGVGQLSVTVVPDSGTDQLVGLSGRMDIKIADGKHLYDFQYTIPQAP